MKVHTLTILTVLLTQALCKPEVKSSTFATPANLSYDELLYILKVRSGEQPKPRRLSPCARAILGCCRERVMNEHCSETLKCGAFFFDVNPCEDKFIIDALNAARAFYEQFNSVTS
ncbi:hypothetical protein O0L34_g4220 [Tuta absoluta]|nr:hypothetical protein O0L34_g4220 [Tuta absoluta]